MIVGRNYEAAIREYNTLLKELTGDDANTLRLRRKTLYRLGRLHYLFMNLPDQALEYYKQVVAIDPRAPLSYNALAGMGKIYQDTMQNYPQAVLAYQTLIAYFPRHKNLERYRYRLIDSYFKMGNFSQVRAEGRMALALKPDGRYSDDILYLVAEACLMEGDRQEAESSLREIIEKYPKSEWKAQAHYELAEMMEGRGELEEALKNYREAYLKFGDSAVLKKKIETIGKRLGK